MDVENVKIWATQPDVCRCCLSTSGEWDLTASYVEDDVKEIFAKMLQECFDINLSHLSEWGPSRMICAMCVGHLRNACTFKRKVREAEQHFVNVQRRKKEACTVLLSNIKCEEIKSEVVYEDYFGHSYVADSDAKEDKVQISTGTNKKRKTKLKSTFKRGKWKKNGTNKRSNKTEPTERDSCDSDTPIAELSKNNLQLSERETDVLENFLEGHSDSTEFGKIIHKDDISGTQNPTIEIKTKNGVKKLSERKRVMITCNIVLRDTTACPFRHHKSWFQCFFCLKDFMEINLLRTHMKETHTDIDGELKRLKRYPISLQIDISSLKCIICSHNLTDVEEMRKHFELTHKKTIYNECIADYKVNTSPYACHICKLEFHMFRSLTTHLNEHYANCICDVCGKSFINSKRLKVHKRTHENGRFPCKECGKVLKTTTSKANHVEIAHSKRVLKCHICSEPMKHYNDRIKHMSEVHNITHKFKCPICSREYNIKHYLATHMRQTHGHKNKKCMDCGMAFITNHGLKKHMLKHTGEKPFICEVCCKSYARNYTLKEHMRTHENDNRFVCME